MRLPIDDPEAADRLNGLSPEKDHYAAMLHACRVEEGKQRRQIARLHNAIRLAKTLSKDPRVKAVLDDALQEKKR